MISVDLLMIGAGPSNIALGIAIEESDDAGKLGPAIMLEKHACIRWHKDMLFPEAQSQVSFLKDLVTLRSPTSRFSFLNFMHKTNRLEEFVNLQTFFPYREEISHYLQWAADELKTVQVRYSSTVTQVTPVLSAENEICGWIVNTEQGQVYRANRLVFGGGRDPNIPAPFQHLSTARLFHSSQYLSMSARFDPKQVAKIAVIGGAQSSAEIYQSCITTFPRASIKLIMRSIGLMNYGGSKFVNRLYDNSQVDVFFSSDQKTKRTMLENMRNTNYAGVAPATMEALYRHHYRQQMSGEHRTQMLTQCEILAADETPAGVSLSWRRNGSATETEVFDFVVLGTGYLNRLPDILGAALRTIGIESVAVDRNYRAVMPCAPGVSLHLQGVNENTHGIADSLLSVLAHRSVEIFSDMLGEEARDRKERRFSRIATAA